MDYFEKDWDLILNVGKNDVNHYFDNFFFNLNGLLDNYGPFKKVSKYQLKLKEIETHDKDKHCWNLLSTVIKKSKKNHYSEFFENNINN